MALMMTRYLLVCVLGSASLADADVMLKSDVDYGVLYPMLGKNNLDELTDNYTLEVDDECNYNLTVSWLQNPEFPVGGPDTCLPSVIADYDGNSMLEARWFYQEYPQYVQDAIDINHLSLDWNPCGHPIAGFLVPHFDLHFYRVSPEFRATKMNCELIPGTPACWPEQFYEEGQKFFSLEKTESGEIKNMPPGFHVRDDEAVVHMGAHAMDPATIPEDPSKWLDPTFVLLNHDSRIVCVEPMLPFQFAIGDKNQYNDQNLIYVDQTDMTLPDRVISKYTADTRVISVSLHGKSNVCKAEFEASRAAFESMEMSSAYGRHTFWNFFVTSSLALLIWSGFLR